MGTQPNRQGPCLETSFKMAEGDAAVVVDEIAAELAEQEVEEAPLNIVTALQIALKKSLIYDGLARGLREAVRALDKREAYLCVLASNCDEASYVSLVEALCLEHGVDLIKVESNKELDEEGVARKVCACSCVVIKNWGVESEARDFIINLPSERRVRSARRL